jgi:hypothetical protein
MERPSRRNVVKQKSQAWAAAALSLFACARAEDLDTARDEPPAVDGSPGTAAGSVGPADAQIHDARTRDAPAAEPTDAVAPDGEAHDAASPDANTDADADAEAGLDAAPPPGCGPASCRGCCDTRGRCQGGTSDYTCGSGGEACVDCRAISRICSIRGVCY